MKKRRILGIDFGFKKIGIAVSDFDHILAMPCDMVDNAGHEKVLEKIQNLCEKYDISKIVFGNPVGFEDDEKNIIEHVHKFAELARERLGIGVAFEDERYTTIQAKKYMREAGIKEKKMQNLKDSISAAILLQTYLDRLNAKLK